MYRKTRQIKKDNTQARFLWYFNTEESRIFRSIELFLFVINRRGKANEMTEKWKGCLVEKVENRDKSLGIPSTRIRGHEKMDRWIGWPQKKEKEVLLTRRLRNAN